MVFAVNMMHGCGPSSKICPQLHLKKIKVNLYYRCYFGKRYLVHCTLLFLKRWKMVFAIGKTCGYGLSNKMHPQLQSKNTNALVFIIAIKGVIRTVHCYQDCGALVLKVGVSYSWLALKRRLVHSVMIAIVA